VRYPKDSLHLGREHDYPLLRQLAHSALPRAANFSNTCSYAVVANAAVHSTGEPKGSFSMTLSADGRCPRWERSTSTR